jgi:hypothetical protein
MKILFFIVLFSLLGIQLQATTLYVNPKGKVISIHEALAIAKANDTIIVSAGTYHEKNIMISKPVVLIGENYPVLDGEHQYEIISVKSDHVTIEGFHFRNSGYSDLTELGAIKNYRSRLLQSGKTFLKILSLQSITFTQAAAPSSTIASIPIHRMKSNRGMVFIVGDVIACI